MMGKYFFAILLVCMAASVIYKRWAETYALRELYALRSEAMRQAAGAADRQGAAEFAEADDCFIRALESGFMRLQFGVFTRTFMKLNYFVDRDNEQKVRDLVPVFGTMKLKPDEEIALYYKLYEYGLKKGWREDVENYSRHLEMLLKNHHNGTSVRVKRGV